MSFLLDLETSLVNIINENIFYILLVVEHEYLERTAQSILMAVSLECLDLPCGAGANVPISRGNMTLRLIRPVKGSNEERI